MPSIYDAVSTPIEACKWVVNIIFETIALEHIASEY